MIYSRHSGSVIFGQRSPLNRICSIQRSLAELQEKVAGLSIGEKGRVMNASDVMVRDVVTVGPEEPVSKAVQLLVDHDISALPVVDSDRRVIGILNEADLLHRERIGTEKHRAWWIEAVTPPSVLALDYAKSHGRRVAELMSEDIISANEDTPLSKLANILEKHRIKRVPILKDASLLE
jgi:CBS-domain-containing membrane protein